MLSRSFCRQTSVMPAALKSSFQAKLATEKARIAQLLKDHGSKVLSESTVDACYHGTRGVTTMVYEPSLLDAQEGIRFRGLSIPECSEKLPKWGNGTQMIPEGMFWLLLTGNVPTDAEAMALSENLYERATSAEGKAALAEAEAVIAACPASLHPMNKLVAGTVALGRYSRFAKAYLAGGLKKPDYWEPTLEDSLDLIGRMTPLCASIFHQTYNGSAKVAIPTGANDWTGRFTTMLQGKENAELAECLRLYMSIHVDHEGGNVSAHATQLVGSALSDPYLAFAGGMTGLAGPLHGLANQEVLSFFLEMQKQFPNLAAEGREELKKQVETYAWSVLNAGRVIPGYGHAVLRQTDPRYMALRKFALDNFPNDPLFKLVDASFEVFPAVLTKHGKTKNPFPNVDAGSGCVLRHYGLTQEDFYTVLFGMSRALGVLAANTWNRALGWPIERPKSCTTDELCKKFYKN